MVQEAFIGINLHFREISVKLDCAFPAAGRFNFGNRTTAAGRQIQQDRIEFEPTSIQLAQQKDVLDQIVHAMDTAANGSQLGFAFVGRKAVQVAVK